MIRQRFSMAVILLSVFVGGGCATHAPVASNQDELDSPYRSLDTIKDGEIIHLPTGIAVTKDQLFDALSGSRVVYIGETHTNVKDHEVELEVLKGLSERFPGQVAVGMEMFQRPSQEKLDRWIRGELDEKVFVEEWIANWNQSYRYYQDILRYVRDHKIPLIALNASEEIVNAVMEKGPDGISDEMKKVLPEMDRSDPYHRKSLEAVFGGHAHGKEGFDRFYQTMLIWDETMAQSVADYLSSPDGKARKMVVMTGGFHAGYGFGVPKRVFRRMPIPYSIVMPYTSAIPGNRNELLMMDVKPVSVPLHLADFIWAVGYEDLEDEIVHLGVRIEGNEKGVAVRSVVPASTAEKIGIQEGDIILSFDGQTIGKPFDLTYLISQKQLGDRATLQILRGERTFSLDAMFESNARVQ